MKYLYAKLFCGITDSKTAYEDYKRILSNSGFSFRSGTDYFVAENETFTVCCQLDGYFITVIKVEKNEESLINQLSGVRCYMG